MYYTLYTYHFTLRIMHTTQLTNKQYITHNTTQNTDIKKIQKDRGSLQHVLESSVSELREKKSFEDFVQEVSMCVCVYVYTFIYVYMFVFMYVYI